MPRRRGNEAPGRGAKGSKGRSRTPTADARAGPGSAARRVRAVRVASASSNAPRLIADVISLRRIDGELVLEATSSAAASGAGSNCRAVYEGGMVSCFGTCRQGRMCEMIVKQTRKKVTFLCRCGSESAPEPGPGDDEVISYEDWQP
jgi:hypothetical protein